MSPDNAVGVSSERTAVSAFLLMPMEYVRDLRLDGGAFVLRNHFCGLVDVSES